MRNDPYHELETKTEGHRRRLDAIDGKLRERSNNLHDVRDQLGKLKNNIGDHSINAIAKKTDDMAKKLDKTNSRLDKESAKITELRRDLETVHRKVRVSSGLPHADFDNWEQISPEMITAIRAGLASTPVPETKLQHLRKNQEGAQKELVEWDKSLEAAKQAVQGLTQLPLTRNVRGAGKRGRGRCSASAGRDRSRSRSEHVSSATRPSALTRPQRRPPSGSQRRTASPVRRSASGWRTPSPGTCSFLPGSRARSVVSRRGIPTGSSGGSSWPRTSFATGWSPA